MLYLAKLTCGSLEKDQVSNESTVRIAVASERTDLESLQLRSSLANGSDRDSLLENPDAIDLPVEQIEAGQVFVIECGGKRVGFAALLSVADGIIELDGLFIEPNEWKRGFGKKLLQHCVGYAIGCGVTSIYVTGNSQAEGFYKSCGFEVVGTEQTRFGAGLRMKLSIG